MLKKNLLTTGFMFTVGTFTLFASVVILASPSTVCADIYRVDANSPATSPDGSSWTMAYQLLQDAMDRATTGDTIRVAGGSYRPDLDTTDLFPPEHLEDSRTESFSLKAGVIVLGGFSGNANLSAPDVRGIAVSVLTGDIGTQSDASDNSFHIVTGGTATEATLLDGFTIKLGNGNGTTDSTRRGAGIYLFNQNEPRIENCIIEYCTVDDSIGMGGGLYTEAGAIPEITSCIFRYCSAGAGGGVAFAAGSGDLIQLQGCSFSENQAGTGGALFSKYPTEIRQSDFSLNTATCDASFSAGGGALAVWETNLVMRECNISHNTVDARSTSAVGGGLYADSIIATVIRCNFIANKIISNDSDPFGAQGGGAFIHPGGYVYNCLFQENGIETELAARSGTGGALVVSKGAQVVNSLFFDNYAYDGGGIWVWNLPSTFINCTITRNNATNNAGGILFAPISVFDPGSQVRNCILWENTAGNETVEEQQVYAGSTDGKIIRHNIIQGRFDTGQYDSDDDIYNLDADPMFYDAAHDNFRLMSCSIGLDYGDTRQTPIDALNVRGALGAPRPAPVPIAMAIAPGTSTCIIVSRTCPSRIMSIPLTKMSARGAFKSWTLAPSSETRAAT